MNLSRHYVEADYAVFLKEVEIENKESLQSQSDTKKIKAEIQNEVIQNKKKDQSQQ